MVRVIAWIAFLIGIISAAPELDSGNFNGYQIYSVIPKSLDDVKVLQNLERNGFDFWTKAHGLNTSVDIMVGPHHLSHFFEVVETQKMAYKIFISNLEERIEKEKLRLFNSRRFSSGFNFNEYHRLDAINNYMMTLSSKYSQLNVIAGGKSYEGRNLTGVHLSYKQGNPAIVIDGGIHAREWITPASVLFVLTELLTNPDENIRYIAENYDWYFFPSINPDGYEYSHTKNRLWRKTRQPYGKFCTGADGNRNWDMHFGENVGNHVCALPIYGGPFAFSEVETKTFSEFLTTLNGTLFGYISLHSYSQLLLIPYGYTPSHLDNYDDMFAIGKKAAKAMAKRYGTEYTVGNPPEVIYTCSGLSMDWVKANLKPPVAFTYELRDTGEHGFLLPPEQIIPSGEEVMDSILTILLEAEQMGYK